MVFIRDFQEGDRVTGTYLVRTKATYQSKRGKDYFSLTLGDRTGTVDTKIWDTESPAIDDFEANDFVNVSGTVTVFVSVLPAVSIADPIRAIVLPFVLDNWLSAFCAPETA